MRSGVNPPYCGIESPQIVFVLQISERVRKQGSVTRRAESCRADSW